MNKRYSEERYCLVKIESALRDIAYKRNNGNPPYDFPSYFDYIYPQVNTKYYHADVDGRLKQGGLFSLDGVHPSAIGHGLLAYEFLNVMQDAGVKTEADVVVDSSLDWQEIFANDMLYSKPITLMQELYGKDDLAKHIIKLIQLFKD